MDCWDRWHQRPGADVPPSLEKQSSWGQTGRQSPGPWRADGLEGRGRMGRDHSSTPRSNPTWAREAVFQVVRTSRQAKPRLLGLRAEQGPGPGRVKVLGLTSRTEPTPAATAVFLPSCRQDAGLRSITFERPSSGVSYPDAADGLPASLHVALCCCKSGTEQAH